MVNGYIFHSISAQNLLAGKRLVPEASGLGIYFHIYKNAGRPFYIGIFDDMADRNQNRLKNCREKATGRSKIPAA